MDFPILDFFSHIENIDFVFHITLIRLDCNFFFNMITFFKQPLISLAV